MSSVIGRVRSQSQIEISSFLTMVMVIAAIVFSSKVCSDLLLPDVTNIARQVTVRIDGANTGSGVIVEHSGDRYRVLTSWHVVEPSGKFTLSTFDGKKHQISRARLRRIPRLDLAVVDFQSKNRYRVAKIGNSDRAIEGDKIYVAGWADPSPQLAERTYQFLVGYISGRLRQPVEGYGLVYTVNALPGMSGGAVFNRQGHAIAINGRATTDVRTGTVNAVLGIEMARYVRQNVGNHHRQGRVNSSAKE